MMFKNLKELEEHKEKINSEIESMQELIDSKARYLMFLEKNSYLIIEPSEGRQEKEWINPFSLRGLVQPGINAINDKISKIDERLKRVEDIFGAIYPYGIKGEERK